MNEKPAELEACGGLLGNFYRRRRIERDARARVAVGRTVPRQVEDSLLGSAQSGFFAKGKLVDERG